MRANVSIATAGRDTESKEWSDMSDHFTRLAAYLKNRGIGQRHREEGDVAQALSQELECRRALEELARDFPGEIRLD